MKVFPKIKLVVITIIIIIFNRQFDIIYFCMKRVSRFLHFNGPRPGRAYQFRKKK